MNRILADQGADLGLSAGRAYGANAAGSVLGCCLTGLVLLRAPGVNATLLAAAAVNLAVAAAAWRLAAASAASERAASEKRSAEGGPLPAGLAAAYFGIGFVALGYETVWLRVLALQATGGIVTFTALVAVFLAGLAAGGLVFYPALARACAPRTILALAAAGAGATAMGAIPFFHHAIPRLTRIFLMEPAGTGALDPVGGVASLFRVEFSAAILVALLPSLFLGLAYPAACGVVGKGSGGRLYCLGNLGSGFGAAAVALVLAPALGLTQTLGALSAAAFGIAGLTLAISWRSWRLGGFLFCLLAAGGALLWGNAAPPVTRAGALETRADGTPRAPILRYAVGRSATVIVRAQGTHLSMRASTATLSIDDQVVASASPAGLIDAKLLAHLPLLLCEQPARALTVGFGSGVTSRAMAAHGIAVDAVEIEPEVIRSADLFADINAGVLSFPNFRLVLDDARHHLLVTPARYDVISTDCTNLQYKQNGSLYTREYFALMKARLAPGGIACAWTPMSAVTPGEFATLLATFADVFPHATLWFANHWETRFAILIATPGPLQADLTRWKRAFADPAVRGDLAGAGIHHPFQLFHCLHLDAPALRRFCAGAPFHTDDRPILELSSPLSFYFKTRTFLQNLEVSAPLRPADHALYATEGTLGEDERALFAAHGEAARLWTQAQIALLRSQMAASSEEGLAYFLAAERMAREAASRLPENPAARALAEHLSRQLKR